MSPRLLLTAVTFVVVVITAWFSPKPHRPWFRAAVLMGTSFIAPRSSFFVWLVTTTFCLVPAALLVTYREPGSFRTALRDGLATGRASVRMKTHMAGPFLRIAAATYFVLSFVVLARRNTHVPWGAEAALVLVNAALLVPKGSRRWFFLSLYYLAAACILWVRYAPR